MRTHWARIGKFTSEPRDIAAIRIDPRTRFGDPRDVLEAVYVAAERDFVCQLHSAGFLVGLLIGAIRATSFVSPQDREPDRQEAPWEVPADQVFSWSQPACKAGFISSQVAGLPSR